MTDYDLPASGKASGKRKGLNPKTMTKKSKFALIGILVLVALGASAPIWASPLFINGPTTTVTTSTTQTATYTSAPVTITTTQQNTELDVTYIYSTNTTVTGSTATVTSTITTTSMTSYDCPDSPYC